MTSSFSSRTDEDLLSLLQSAGSHAAFSELVTRHAMKYRSLAFRYTNSTTDAEDIVQDAFIQLWFKPQIWDATRSAKFTTWFYRIVVNKCLDHIRRKPARPIGEDEEFTDAAILQDEALEEREKMTAVENGMRQLRPDMQTALNLSFYEAVPNQDAADIMGLSLKAFQSLLMRAKQALRDNVAKHMPRAEERMKRYGT